MAFHSEPTGKGGAGVGDKLSPAMVRYDDVMFIDVGTYAFGFGGGQRNHCVCVIPITMPSGADPLRSAFTMTYAAVNMYTLDTTIGRFFDSVQMIVNGAAPGAAPATSVFKNNGATEILRIDGTLFPTEHAYYLVGVCENNNAPAGPLVVGRLLNFRMVFVQRRSLSIFDAVAAGVDTATLNFALTLAGHNVKLRDPAFIDGLPSQRTVVGFDRALEAVGTPSLEDPDSDEGITGDLDLLVTSTPDAYRNVAQDLSTD